LFSPESRTKALDEIPYSVAANRGAECELSTLLQVESNEIVHIIWCNHPPIPSLAQSV
jgi:hypothetical protein